MDYFAAILDVLADPVLVATLVKKLLLSALALWLLFRVTSAMDRRAGIDLRQVSRLIHEDPQAASRYRGWRIWAVAFVVAWCFGS